MRSLVAIGVGLAALWSDSQCYAQQKTATAVPHLKAEVLFADNQFIVMNAGEKDCIDITLTLNQSYAYRRTIPVPAKTPIMVSAREFTDTTDTRFDPLHKKATRLAITCTLSSDSGHHTTTRASFHESNGQPVWLDDALGPAPVPVPASTLLRSSAATVEKRLGKPTRIDGHRWTYVTASGSLAVYCDDADVVVDVDPKAFNIATIKR